MALVSCRQPSALVSNGLSAATVALNIAGAATDAVPIAKQILNSAAHISAVAEKIQKKREAMYTLVEKADIYATQISSAVAGRILDASLQRRLERLYSQIEALVEAKVGSKNNALTRVWQNVVTKPNRAETLVVELEREIQLFQLLTGIQMNLIVEDTARAVVADARYDGQLRLLRDCDIDKRDIIARCETDEGTVLWASARVDGQLMVIRYIDSSSICTRGHNIASEVFLMQRVPYHEYLENIKKVSTVRDSHPHIVKLYGRHAQHPEAVFRSGTLPVDAYLKNLTLYDDNKEAAAVTHLILAYKILHASAHLSDVHGLRWVGLKAVVDENGEPHIGLFDDIVATNIKQPYSGVLLFQWSIFIWFNPWFCEETGAVGQVHHSYLHAIVMEELRNGNETDRLQQVWDIIQQEKLHVAYHSSTFPFISERLSLSQELIARARSYFDTNTKECNSFRICTVAFVRHVIAGGGSGVSSQVCICIRRSDQDTYVEVNACTHDGSHIRLDQFTVFIPSGYPLLADITRAAGLPDDFEHSWDGRTVQIYLQQRFRSDCDASSGFEDEDEDYATADEGEESFDLAVE